MKVDCMPGRESDRHTRAVRGDGSSSPAKAPARTVHLSNIANVAYANCKILESRGIDVALYCHDMTHVT